MQYTQNYHLPQWVKEDRIMMEDFNAMNSSIESGLNTANTNASTAVSTANTAKQTADAAAAAKPYVVGTYTGTGANLTINLGFRPSFLIISGMRSTLTTNSTIDYDRYHAITAGNVMSASVKITATGFTAYMSGSINGFSYPSLSEPGRVYDYIAFK